MLRVDEPCPELLGLYRAKNISCAAFITACNPFSQELSDAENAAKQTDLAADQKMMVLDLRKLFIQSLLARQNKSC